MLTLGGFSHLFHQRVQLAPALNRLGHMLRADLFPGEISDRTGDLQEVEDYHRTAQGGSHETNDKGIRGWKRHLPDQL